MNHGDNREGDISFESLENTGIQEKGTNKSLFRNWPLMSAVILYCIFSLHDMAYSEVFSLWAVSPKTFGLGFSTNKVGVVLTISGGGLLVFQTFLYPLIERILGPVMVSRVAAVLSVPVLQSYPFIAMLFGFSFLILLNCASMLMNVLTDQKQRGAANGIAMTGMSLLRGLGPAIGGFLVSWTQKRQDTSFLPGSHMMFFVINVILVTALAMIFRPFLVTLWLTADLFKTIDPILYCRRTY